MTSGVVSLYDVLQFSASFFTKMVADLCVCQGKVLLEERDTKLHPAAARLIFGTVNDLASSAQKHGMISAGQKCKRIADRLVKHQMDVSCGSMMDDISALFERIEDDLQRQYFLHLTVDQAEQFMNPLKDWEDVAQRFSPVRYNVEESGRCFGLERYGASVFHVLQVAEYGVIQLATLLGQLGDKPGWSCVARLQRLVSVPFPQRTLIAQQHSNLLENTLPLATAMKDSWRHKLDHVDNQIRWVDTDFSPGVAQEIIFAVRGFMRKLANELPK